MNSLLHLDKKYVILTIDLGSIPVWLVIVIGGMLILFMVIFLGVALATGREVVFWPPKIGQKVSSHLKEEKKTEKSIENDKIHAFGSSFLEQGLTKFHFTRDDYGRTLASFLEIAKSSITIVSISLKITGEEGQLIKLFRRKLAQNQNFEINISLINPDNDSLIDVVANTLDISKIKLKREITEMLKDLSDCYQSLQESEKSRFKILVHDCFPMGSVIMLDASPTGGMIQIETKLYKAPRTESFGFQISKESQFFRNNYTAWQRIISDSKPIQLNA